MVNKKLLQFTHKKSKLKHKLKSFNIIIKSCFYYHNFSCWPPIAFSTNQALIVMRHRQLKAQSAHQIIECTVLEWLKGDTPLVGENRLTRKVNKHCFITKSLTHVEGPCSHLECHIVDENRWFLRANRAYCTRFPNTCQHRIISLHLCTGWPSTKFTIFFVIIEITNCNQCIIKLMLIIILTRITNYGKNCKTYCVISIIDILILWEFKPSQ